MSISYDLFAGAFLSKVAEFDLIRLDDFGREQVVDGYLRRACAQFDKICPYDLTSRDDDMREFNLDIPEDEIDEIVDIISEGMLVQWMKPYVYRQENLENLLNTRDFTSYSPAELLMRIGNAYAKAQRDYTNAIREFSYNHGDLTGLHL